ncbi:nascent polypeptide-associated complex protein [Candidatus Woesearchaeota archaeon]|nr:nascent polypeptide-associated complex protein [Candidatus Woesearchaeota archaeon]
MFPGMNPRKMQQMMKQLGIQQVDIPATEVIIKTENKEIVINNPSVAKVNMMGQETFQISGEVEERELSVGETRLISDEDIQTVMEQTGASEEKARKALEESQGDLAEAILNLKK